MTLLLLQMCLAERWRYLRCTRSLEPKRFWLCTKVALVWCCAIWKLQCCETCFRLTLMLIGSCLHVMLSICTFSAHGSWSSSPIVFEQVLFAFLLSQLCSSLPMSFYPGSRTGIMFYKLSRKFPLSILRIECCQNLSNVQFKLGYAG